MAAQDSEIVSRTYLEACQAPIRQKDFQKADTEQWKKLPNMEIWVPIPAGSGSSGGWKEAI